MGELVKGWGIGKISGFVRVTRKGWKGSGDKKRKSERRKCLKQHFVQDPIFKTHYFTKQVTVTGTTLDLEQQTVSRIIV